MTSEMMASGCDEFGGGRAFRIEQEMAVEMGDMDTLQRRVPLLRYTIRLRENR